jgi:hypothetical protein
VTTPGAGHPEAVLKAAQRQDFKRVVRNVARLEKNHAGWTFNRREFVSDWMAAYDLGQLEPWEEQSMRDALAEMKASRARKRQAPTQGMNDTCCSTD